MPDIIVRNQVELDAALKAAKGGETIKLAAGTYSSVTIKNQNFASNVTITSLDSTAPVNISKFAIYGSSNVTLKNLIAQTDFKPADDWAQLNNIGTSKNITVDSVKISGGTGDPSASKGYGLFVRDSSGVVVKNSSFDHFALGMSAQNDDGMQVLNNSFHDNRRDHTNFTEMSNLVIDGNTFTNLFPVGGEHPDAIQFLTAGKVKGNQNITISNNVIMQGAGAGAQGIFLNEEAGNLPYVNVNIKNNLIYLNGEWQGINVVHGQNVNIQSNTVVSKPDSVDFWIRLDKVNGGTVSNNVTDRIMVVDTSTNVTVGTNVVLNNDSAAIRKLSGLLAGGAARLSDLIIPGAGYQPPAGSAAAAVVQSELALTTPAAASLLLDLSFNGNGLIDNSLWGSSVTTKTVDLTAVSGNAFHIATGTGLELTRANTRQVYSLSAFSLSFDFRRDSATSSVGQIMGIFQSWGLSLQANGELSYTMKNTAGQSYTVTTKGAGLTNTASHKIALTYDSARNLAVIYVDGVARGSGTVKGTTQPVQSWGLYLGGQFTNAASGTIGDIELRDSALSAAQVVSLGVASSTTSADSVKYSLTKGLVSTATSLLAADGGTATVQSLAPVATLATTTTVTAASTQVSQLQAVLANSVVSGVGTFGTSGFGALLSARSSSFDLYHA